MSLSEVNAHGNTAIGARTDGSGGGILVNLEGIEATSASNVTVTVTDTFLSNNTARGDTVAGGGLCLAATSGNLTFANVTLRRVAAIDNTGLGPGGGVYISMLGTGVCAAGCECACVHVCMWMWMWVWVWMRM